MCGRYTLTVNLADIEKRFEAKAEAGLTWSPRYNIAPSQAVPVVTAPKGVRTISYMTWGLIPSWTKVLEGGVGEAYKFKSAPPINARLETVDEKPTFKTAFLKRRALIPADSFYEWKEGGTKAPYRLSLPEPGLFCFAGIWDHWQTPGGDNVLSFAILTDEAQGNVSQIHHRVPVILTPSLEKVWLNPDLDDGTELKEWVRYHRSKDLQFYEVSPLVNSPDNDVPECLEPATGEGRHGQGSLQF